MPLGRGDLSLSGEGFGLRAWGSGFRVLGFGLRDFSSSLAVRLGLGAVALLAGDRVHNQYSEPRPSSPSSSLQEYTLKHHD